MFDSLTFVSDDFSSHDTFINRYFAGEKEIIHTGMIQQAYKDIVGGDHKIGHCCYKQHRSAVTCCLSSKSAPTFLDTQFLAEVMIKPIRGLDHNFGHPRGVQSKKKTSRLNLKVIVKYEMLLTVIQASTLLIANNRNRMKTDQPCRINSKRQGEAKRADQINKEELVQLVHAPDFASQAVFAARTIRRRIQSNPGTTPGDMAVSPAGASPIPPWWRQG